MKNKNIVIEDAQIRFLNFSGKEGKFNPAGRRNFCVFLSEEQANGLEDLGWNVKYLKSKEEGEPDQAYIQVTVSYSNKPPKIVLITSKGKSLLDEDSVNILDWAEIERVDLSLSPYEWEFVGRTGIKAYLKSMFVTLVEDELEEKYYDVPDSARNVIMEDD